MDKKNPEFKKTPGDRLGSASWYLALAIAEIEQATKDSRLEQWGVAVLKILNVIKPQLRQIAARLGDSPHIPTDYAEVLNHMTATEYQRLHTGTFLPDDAELPPTFPANLPPMYHDLYLRRLAAGFPVDDLLGIDPAADLRTRRLQAGYPTEDVELSEGTIERFGLNNRPQKDEPNLIPIIGYREEPEDYDGVLPEPEDYNDSGLFSLEDDPRVLDADRRMQEWQDREDNEQLLRDQIELLEMEIHSLETKLPQMSGIDVGATHHRIEVLRGELEKLRGKEPQTESEQRASLQTDDIMIGTISTPMPPGVFEDSSNMIQRSKDIQEIYRLFKIGDVVGIKGTGDSGYVLGLGKSIPSVMVHQFTDQVVAAYSKDQVEKIDLGIRIEPFFIEYRSPLGEFRAYATNSNGSPLWHLYTEKNQGIITLAGDPVSSMRNAAQWVYEQRLAYLAENPA